MTLSRDRILCMLKIAVQHLAHTVNDKVFVEDYDDIETLKDKSDVSDD